MKKFAFFIAIISISTNAFCQDITKKCLENAEIISTLIENKNFNDAEKTWTDLNKKCNNLNEKFYKNGETIFENKKELATTLNEKKAIILQLIQLYNQYNQKFPANQNQNGTKKALYLSYYNIGTNDEIFAALDRDFKNDNANFKNPEALYLYFNSFVNQYKSNKNNISIADLITKNTEITQKIESESKSLEQNAAVLITKQKTEPLSGLENTNLKKHNENLTAINNANQAIQSLISPYFTCENLVRFGNTQFETNQNNSFWLANISEKLFANSCYTDPILEKIVQKSYEINPTSKAAMHMGYIYLKKNNTEKANILFNEAADKALDNNQKAEIYYTIATVVFGLNDKQKSLEYSNKALATDATFAKAYLYQTQLIESGIEECKTTDFEKKAINWLLSETVLKSGKANKIYEKSSKTKSENYLKKAPTKADLKTFGMKVGDKITLNCWLNQSIEIPKF